MRNKRRKERNGRGLGVAIAQMETERKCGGNWAAAAVVVVALRMK